LQLFRLSPTEVNQLLDTAGVDKQIIAWQKKYRNRLGQWKKGDIVRGLSVQQPFVEAILQGKKKTENRRWPLSGMSIPNVRFSPSKFAKNSRCRFCSSKNQKKLFPCPSRLHEAKKLEAGYFKLVDELYPEYKEFCQQKYGKEYWDNRFRFLIKRNPNPTQTNETKIKKKKN